MKYNIDSYKNLIIIWKCKDLYDEQEELYELVIIIMKYCENTKDIF